MKILLINPMASRKAPLKGRPAHFPVGLGLISAVLKENGFKVDVLDNETECLSKHELMDYIKQSDYDVYGITGMSPQYSYIKGLSRLIKRLKDRPIVLGGPLATYSYEVVLKNTCVDICVLGEGEETTVDLLDNLPSLERVTGIAYKTNENIFKNSPRIYKKSRDSYPFPDYDSFNMQPYFEKALYDYEPGLAACLFNPLKSTATLKTIGIVTGMGCPYHCAFCSRSVNKIRLRSVNNIIEEIRFLKDKYDIEGILFLDDLLIINKKRTMEFCEKINPFNLVWSGQARADFFTDEIAKAIKNAGCISVGLGLESGSERMLKAMNKKTTVEKNEKAMRVALNNNLMVKVQLLFGFSGENLESIEKTIALFKRVEVPPRRFNILTPLPGSPLYDECLKKGLISNEDKYLEEVSKYEAGFGSKRVLINLTEMTNDEFEALLKYAETTMEKNFEDIIKKRYLFWHIRNLYLILLRKAYKIVKVFNLSVWKRKFKSIVHKVKGRELTREEIEKIYFQLQ